MLICWWRGIGDGNPVGGNVTSNVSGSDVFYEEWMVRLKEHPFSYPRLPRHPELILCFGRCFASLTRRCSSPLTLSV